MISGSKEEFLSLGVLRVKADSLVLRVLELNPFFRLLKSLLNSYFSCPKC
jgi:hypothetical protein